MSKKLEQKQQRRAAEERRAAEQKKAALKRNALTIGAALLVTAIVVTAIVMQRNSGTGPGATENVGVAAAQAGCEEIEKPDEQEGAHIEVGTPHDPYSSSPPTSGPHYVEPAVASFYPDQQTTEQLVHNLEHSQIVIWYQPDAPAETLDSIEAVVGQESQATLAAPFPDIEPPYQLALTAWGALQRCEQVSQEVIDDFRREYQGKGPEQIVPPFEG